MTDTATPGDLTVQQTVLVTEGLLLSQIAYGNEDSREFFVLSSDQTKLENKDDNLRKGLDALATGNGLTSNEVDYLVDTFEIVEVSTDLNSQDPNDTDDLLLLRNKGTGEFFIAAAGTNDIPGNPDAVSTGAPGAAADPGRAPELGNPLAAPSPEEAEEDGLSLWLVELIAPFATDENKHREAALGQLMKTEFRGHTLNIPKVDARTGKRSVLKVEG